MHYILSYWISIQICNWGFDVGKIQISIGVGPEKKIFGSGLTFLFYTGFGVKSRLNGSQKSLDLMMAKGQIISEGNFGVFKSHNK